MKKIIKSIDKDFPPIVFGCDFCGGEFAVSPPEEDMKIESREKPILDESPTIESGFIFPVYNVKGFRKITKYITHCPVCGERVSWSVKKEEYNNEEDY